MTKKFFYLAAAATVLAGCSALEQTGSEEKSGQRSPQAVGFGAYLNQGVSTKAGHGGILTTSGATYSLQTVGFGVFGYYSDGGLYNESTSKPDFMYNEKVSYETDHWTYSPIKYWPNEFGAQAISDETDRLSFFAYAPYVEVNNTTGIPADAESGIIALSRNTAAGDPYVKYAVSFEPATSVDLCWGVAATAYSSSVDPSTPNSIQQNWPYIDLWKPAAGEDGYINFNFKHALAALNVQIDAVVDASSSGTVVDANTKIYVRSVSFEGFTTKGTLNLNSSNTTSETECNPNWGGIAIGSKLDASPITVYDGRRDGKEALYAATNESPAGLNESIIQANAYERGTIGADYQYDDARNDSEGVTKDPKNLFKSDTYDDPIFVIPTDETLKVTVVYDVETPDATVTSFLSDGETRGTVVENKISKEITYGTTSEKLQLSAGKKYTLILHLGMQSVQFDATVADWTEVDPATGYLPIN